MAEYRSKYTGAEVDAFLDKIAEDNVGDIDSALSTESENPVMNKILTARFNGIETRIDSLPTKLSQFEDDVVAGKYLPLSGGTITSTNEEALHIYRASGPVGIKLSNNEGNAWVGFSSAVYGAYLYTSSHYLHITNGGEACFDNQPLIHSGNIGDYNAGSATKLQTARTIWGHSFDGTGDVDGYLHMSGLDVLHLDESNLWLNFGAANDGKSLRLCGNDVAIYYGESSNFARAMTINSSGNVTIGGSDLAGTEVKLHVADTRESNGYLLNARFLSPNLLSGGTSVILFGKSESNNNRAYMGYSHSSDGSTNNAITFGFYGQDKIVNFLANGNVGIGTSSPAYKLEVNGTIYAKQGVALGSGIPIILTALGDGTYNKVTLEHTSAGLVLERARIDDNASAAVIPFIISQRGGGVAAKFDGDNLYIKGDLLVGGNIVADGTITPSTASASYSLRGGTSNKTVVIIEVGSTEETIEHGLGADVAVSLYAKNNDSWVLTSNGDIEITDTAVIVTFDNPTIVEYKVVIVG